jgi:hypothetical protein
VIGLTNAPARQDHRHLWPPFGLALAIIFRLWGVHTEEIYASSTLIQHGNDRALPAFCGSVTV